MATYFQVLKENIVEFPLTVCSIPYKLIVQVPNLSEIRWGLGTDGARVGGGQKTLRPHRLPV